MQDYDMTHTEPLAIEEEAALISAAQAGDEGAMLTLMEQYAPAVRNVIARFRNVLDAEDAEQEAMVGFMELVTTHDVSASSRLAGRVADVLRRHLASAANAASGGWHIPSRTLDRFHAVLRKADGDVMEGARIAPDYSMTRESFLSVAAALRGTESLDTDFATGEECEQPTYALGGDEGDDFAAVDDRDLARYLMSVVADEEREVVTYAYGFKPAVVDGHEVVPEGAAPLADGLVAAATGYSRPKVQRRRVSALATMREALALEEAGA